MSRLESAIAMIEQAREYSLALLESVDEADWFAMPGNGVTHLAWQAGHLATAEYFLTIKRIRGVRPEDESILPASFTGLFGRTSVPVAEVSAYPPIGEIKSALAAVHRLAMRELPNLAESDLDVPVSMPHPIATTKIRSLRWCSQHEMIHAGQIGLLRRLLGHSPRW